MRALIIGAGDYGSVFLSYLRAEGYSVVGFLDDRPALHQTYVDGVPVVGGTSRLSDQLGADAVFVPIGNNSVRVRLLEEARNAGYKTPSYIHPTAALGPNVRVGEGSYILQGASVMPLVEIANACIVSMSANVAHHVFLAEGSFVSTGVNVGARVLVDQRAFLGIGSTVMTGVRRVGRDAVVGAGAVVIREVPDLSTVAGVPARVIRPKAHD